MGLVIWQFDGVLLHFEWKERIGSYLSWKQGDMYVNSDLLFKLTRVIQRLPKWEEYQNITANKWGEYSL